ncbi:MAG: hypothetical protein LBT68_04525, partial [Spirochaetales bacterium]|nr:hypothetical protein [Spirochaetales bacterium]
SHIGNFVQYLKGISAIRESYAEFSFPEKAFSEISAHIVFIDELSATYILTKTIAAHKTLSEIIGDMAVSQRTEIQPPVLYHFRPQDIL